MKRAQAFIAVAAVAVALACVALIVEAGRRIYHSIGPSKAVAASDGSLYVLSHGKLHVFAPGGARRSAIALESLGLTRTPSDLAVHEDGRVVVADPDDATLHRCRLPAGPCEKLDLGLHRVNVQQWVPLNSIKVAIDDRAGRYYVSDNAGHAVVIADFAGHVLARSKPYLFWFPNHLWPSRTGELSVVDTNHHRVAAVSIAGDRFGGIAREMAAGGSGVTRPGRVWPFDAARLPDGRLAVLIADEGMKDADLVVYRDEKAQRRLDLGGDSDPFDVEAWGSRIVVADATNYRLVALDADGKTQADFPPPDFARELGEAQRVPAFWRSVRWGAQAGIVIVPLLAILALWKLGVPIASRPQVPPAARSPAAASAASRERFSLGYSPTFVRRQVQVTQRLALGLMLVLVVAGAGLAYAFADVMLTGQALWRFGPMLALLAIAPLVQIAGMRQARQRFRDFRLESSPEGLRVVGRGRPGEHRIVPWPQVFWDGSRLLAGKAMVAVNMPMTGEMFEREPFERAILARIPPGNFVTRQQLGVQMLRAGGREVIVAGVIIAALTLVYLAARLHLLR